jgi:peptidyl-prolyl cis-trans isomerase D
MLATIRRFAKTWPARVLFVALVGAFGLWGVAGRLYNQNNDSAVAHVGDTRVEALEAQRAYSQQMAQLQKQNGADYQPPPALRQQIATQVVQRLVVEKALSNELTHLGIAVPDAAVRDEAFALPAFKGINGQFDRQTFLSVLARNNLDEASFIALIRDDLARQQLTQAIGAGVAAPDRMLTELFAYSRETRTAIAVTLPTAAATGVAVPTDAQLRRYWANNPSLYATPEYRHIKVIILSPQTLARDIPVTDAEIRNYYNLSKASYDKPELRSVQLVSTQDQATATRLAAAWQSQNWPAIQAQSKAAGATALELPNAKRAELPDAKLAAAAFAAAPETVSAPIKGDFGWYVVKVTQITPGSLTTLAQAHDDIRDKIGVMKAADQIDDRANKVEDALAGGGGLTDLPQGLGVAAVEGTMDATGTTKDGTQAPLPAFPALRDAIIAAAFKAKPGDPPHLEQLPATKDNPSGAYYAVTVDTISKPAQLGYDQAIARVTQDWTHAQQRHIQETQAAQLLAATRAGAPLVTAAQAKGMTAQRLPPIPRPEGDIPPPAGVPQALIAPLFGMAQGDATMVETPDGFVVAQLLTIDTPSPSSDSIGAAQLRTTLNQSVTSDVTNLFVAALQRRTKITVNQTVVQQIAQP